MTTPARSVLLALFTAFIVLMPVGVLAAPLGPTYPMPGGPGEGHGGSTCRAASDAEAAMGKTAAQNGSGVDGQTWYYGGGSDPAVADCPFSATPSDPALLPAFDTTRFDQLFWGMSSPPSLALDGVVDTATETLTLSTAEGDTDLAAGRLVWTGSTTMKWCPPASCTLFNTSAVPTRFVLTATDLAGAPVPLVDPATVDVADPQVGGLVEVTDDLTNYKVNLVMLAQNPTNSQFQPAITMYNSFNHPNPPPVSPQTQMGFGGAFRYTSLAPTGSISGPESPEAGVAATYSADASDPDGATGDTLTYAWDLDNDGAFDDASTQSVQVNLPPGAHTLAAVVTDPDGASAQLTRTVTAVDTTPPVASMTLKSPKLGALIDKGIKGTLTADEASTATVTATITKKLARKLGIKNPVAKRSVALPAADPTPFTVPLTKAAKKKFATLGKVTLTVKAVVVDGAGNKTIVKQTKTYSK